MFEEEYKAVNEFLRTTFTDAPEVLYMRLRRGQAEVLLIGNETHQREIENKHGVELELSPLGDLTAWVEVNGIPIHVTI